MLALAIADQPGLAVNPIEIERGGATYTIDTLRALPGDARYVWLLGADQLANFCTWRAWDEIAERVDMAVAVRPGTPLAARRTGARLRELGRGLQSCPSRPWPCPPRKSAAAWPRANPRRACWRARGRVYCGAQSLDNPPARRARSP